MNELLKEEIDEIDITDPQHSIYDQILYISDKMKHIFSVDEEEIGKNIKSILRLKKHLQLKEQLSEELYNRSLLKTL
jgi:alkyl hydroperoxide reductase subunit AhpC